MGFPDPPRPLEDKPNSWKIYVTCQSTDFRYTDAIADVNVLSESDQLSARGALVTMIAKGSTGMPIQELYDEKVCHPAHEFTYESASGKHSVIQILRIRGSDIRIYFIYLPGRIILILKVEEKRKDKLSKGQKQVLETLATAALDAIEQHTFVARIVP
ncbi:hypothetical protein [Herbaspirillum huttiense]|uniref:hypothetical protein n=1 Tax=Herbaspirillum huttiense TaxID=863372 RepID=UPI0012FE8310|nr:hypothetical protein [Herbaspirillum huttiense]